MLGDVQTNVSGSKTDVPGHDYFFFKKKEKIKDEFLQAEGLKENPYSNVNISSDANEVLARTCSRNGEVTVRLRTAEGSCSCWSFGCCCCCWSGCCCCKVNSVKVNESEMYSLVSYNDKRRRTATCKPT